MKTPSVSGSLGGSGVTAGPVCPGRAVVTSCSSPGAGSLCPRASPAQPLPRLMGETGNRAHRNRGKPSAPGSSRQEGMWDTVTRGAAVQVRGKSAESALSTPGAGRCSGLGRWSSGPAQGSGAALTMGFLLWCCLASSPSLSPACARACGYTGRKIPRPCRAEVQEGQKSTNRSSCSLISCRGRRDADVKSGERSEPEL